MAYKADVICDYDTAVAVLANASKCSSMIELCRNHGISIKEFELALFKYKLKYPQFYTPLERRIEETYTEYAKSGWNLARLANHYGISASTLRYYLLKLKLIATPKNSEDDIESLAYYIKTRGGSVVSALHILGIKMEPHKARKLLLLSGFDYVAYNYAWKRYGNWELQPARPRFLPYKDETVYARCLECGTYHWKGFKSLQSGQSKRCRSCAVKLGFRHEVRDNISGEVFPNTVQAAKKFAPLVKGSYDAFKDRLRKYGFYFCEGVCDLEILNFDKADFHLFVPDVVTEVEIGSRLIVKPIPNDFTEQGELDSTEGLEELAKSVELKAQAAAEKERLRVAHAGHTRAYREREALKKEALEKEALENTSTSNSTENSTSNSEESTASLPVTITN